MPTGGKDKERKRDVTGIYATSKDAVITWQRNRRSLISAKVEHVSETPFNRVAVSFVPNISTFMGWRHKAAGFHRYADIWSTCNTA